MLPTRMLQRRLILTFALGLSGLSSAIEVPPLHLPLKPCGAGKSVYDYIVVGAGTTGCAVASRLAATGVSVLLLDQGKDHSDDAGIYDNSKFTSQFQSPRFQHGFSLEPGMTSSFEATGRRIYAGVSKVFGGASAVNAGGWYRPPRVDFEEWVKLGAKGWGYDEVLPTFRKLEKFQGEPDKPWRGYDGLTPVLYQPLSEVFDKVGFTSAFTDEFQMAFTNDTNNPEQLGYGTLQLTWGKLDHDTPIGFRSGGRRLGNSWDVHLRDKLVKGELPNLDVLEGAKVMKVDGCLDCPPGNGNLTVSFLHMGQQFRVAALSEVVLSAGAIGTPHIALLSGIGPKKELESVGVNAKVDLPGVGQHVLDHPIIWLVAMQSKVTGGRRLEETCVDKLADSMSCKFGGMCECSNVITEHPCGSVPQMNGFPLDISSECAKTCNACSTAGMTMNLPSLLSLTNVSTTLQAYIRSDQAMSAADVELMLGGSACGPDCMMYSGRLYQNKGFAGAEGAEPGYLRLTSADPSDEPEFSRGWWQTEEAILPMVKALRRLVKVLKKMDPSIMLLTPNEFETDINNDEQLRKFLRASAVSELHLAGTMRIGSDDDPNAVLTPELKVRGARRVRVADASVFPTHLRAHPMATCYMVGHRAADFIIQEGGRRLRQLGRSGTADCEVQSCAELNPGVQQDSPGLQQDNSGVQLENSSAANFVISAALMLALCIL